MDGALVGGASLVAEDFCGIVRGALPAAARGFGRLVTLQLRLIDEPAAQAIVSGGAPRDSPARRTIRRKATALRRGCFSSASPRASIRALWCLPGVPGPAEADRPTDSADFPDTGLIVGGIGFHGDPDELGRVEIGYGIVPSQRRNGYATQALHRLVERAGAWAPLRLIAETEAENEPSQGVLRKAGFARFAEDERPFGLSLRWAADDVGDRAAEKNNRMDAQDTKVCAE